MNRDMLNKILVTLIAAGIVANITALFNFSSRLARIEAKLEYLEKPQVARR